MAKYTLTSQTITYNEKTLTRIQATQSFGDIKSGDLGGFIESEANLEQTGNAWIYDNARVCDNAKVSGNAKVRHTALVENSAQIKGNAVVGGDARVIHNAIIEGDADLREHCIIQDNAHILGTAKIAGYAIAQGESTIKGNAKIYGSARVRGDSIVDGESTITDNAQVIDHAQIKGNAHLSGWALVGGYAIVDKNTTLTGEAIITSPKTSDISASLINRILFGKNVNDNITATEAKTFAIKESTSIAGEYAFTEQGYKWILIPENMPDILAAHKKAESPAAPEQASAEAQGTEQATEGEAVEMIKMINDIIIEHEVTNGVSADKISTTYKAFRTKEVIAEAVTLIIK